MNTTPITPSCACAPGLDASYSGWRHQFGHPTGALGACIGLLMALKNRARSLWVLSLLELQPTDLVLEIGFGPGMDVRRASGVVRQGRVDGIDHSEVMVRQARRRNRARVATGRVALRCAPVEHIPSPDETYDTVFSINCVQFWPSLTAALAEQQRVLRPGGRIAIALQPRSAGASAQTSAARGDELAAALRRAGFRDVRLERKELRPVPVVCALAIR